MRVVIQRVNHASVRVDGEVKGAIERGFMLLVGFSATDSEAALQPMAEKIVNLRIFSNEEGKFHFSLLDIKGSALAIPQFTLFADTTRGRRPEFTSALAPAEAKELYLKFCQILRRYVPTEEGVFGADMKVLLENDGPVTINLSSE